MAQDSRPPLYRYGFALLVTAAAVACRAALSSLFGTDLPLILFFPTVTLCAWYGGFGPGLLATVLGALLALFLNVEPFRAINLSNPREVMGLVLFLPCCAFISWICGSLRALVAAERASEANSKFLAEASATLASSLDYEATLAAVARFAVPQFADWCSVDVSDEDGQLKRLAVAHVDPGKVAWAREIQELYPPDPTATYGLYNVLRTGTSEFYPDISDEVLAGAARDERHLELMRRIGFRSAMIIPLKTRDRTLGVLTFVNSDSGRRHTPGDLALAEELARRAGLAVDNARLYRAEQQTRRAAERTSDRLLRLQMVSTVLSQALTPREVVKAVVEQSVNSLGAHAGMVVRLDDDGVNLEIVGAVGFPPGTTEQWNRFPLSTQVPAADAVRGKEPVVIKSPAEWRERYPHLGPLGEITGSYALVAFPLNVEGRTLGAIGLSFKEERSFNDDDRAFMLALAQQCAQSLERARLYETERRLRTEAEAANRLKDEFLATVSHELRTPLTAILGWSRMLISGGLEEGLAARAIETIERNAHSQNQLIEDLLDVSRIITGKLRLDVRPVELSPVVNAAIEALSFAAESKEIDIQYVPGPGVGPVSGDPERLQQVVWNLISNAVKFTPRGGSVRVLLRRVEANVEIVVSDTGAGIRPEFLPYVFDRFRQADATTRRGHGGLGLGLAIVRHLVELHGGTVSADSEGDGQGATFTVVLPLIQTPDAARDERRQHTSAGERGSLSFECPPRLDGLKVLVVDDEPDARELLTAILRSCGADVSTAGSAAEALRQIEESTPDILLSDIGMPGEDGYDLIHKVRATETGRPSKLPAVALTAYAKVEDRIRALSAGFQAHVTKPVEPMEIATVIASLAGRDDPAE